jgi:DNA replication protein DnaC
MNSIQDVFAYLDLQKNREENRKKEWQEGLYARYPELEELESRKKKVIIERLKDIMDSPQDKEDILRKSEEELRLIDKRLQEVKETNGIGEYRNIYICSKCNGTGYCNGVLCSCVRTKAYKELFSAKLPVDLKSSYDAFDSHIFTDQEQLDEAEATKLFLQDYAARFPDNEKKMIVLSGAPGLGKSFHLEGLIHLLSEKEDDICLISAYRLFEAFHRNRLGDFDDIRIIYDARILAVDDLGSEPVTQNVTREYLFDMLTYRMEKGLYTFFVTNNDVRQLQERYSGRVVSRMIGEDSIYLTFEGKDLRLGR